MFLSTRTAPSTRRNPSTQPSTPVWPARLASHYRYFFYTDPTATEIYTLSLHDALPISRDGARTRGRRRVLRGGRRRPRRRRSEEHTSELQSRRDLVCRLLLEKKKKSTIFMTSRVIGSRSFLVGLLT